MIRLENVCKTFNKGKLSKVNAINNTSLSFESKGLVSILGASGSGKTTLLNVIGMLDNADKGNIIIDNIKINKLSTYNKDKLRNKYIGYIFQDFKLIDNLSVYENLEIVLKMEGVKDKKLINELIEYTLDSVNMLRYKKRLCSMLSGGERQRVAIARALVKNPKIIIADEPTGNLDSKNTSIIMNIIKNISKNRLVLLVTHEKNLAYHYSDRIITIEDGNVIDDIKNNNKTKLSYKDDNNIYLKDYKYKDINKSNNINITTYSNNKDKINIDLIIEEDYIYINTNSNLKIEDTKNNKVIIDDYYKEEKIDFKYDISSINGSNYEKKYSSIFKLFSFIKFGFNKVINYSILKKLLLIGFFISGMFITFGISYTFSAIDIKDDDFIKVNKNYYKARYKSISVDNYLELEKSNNINYILPTSSIVVFESRSNIYYQTSNIINKLSGSLFTIDNITKDDLLIGRMPINNKEILVDKSIIDSLKKELIYSQLGVIDYNDYLKLDLGIKYIDGFKIVGITNLNSKSIYVNNNMLNTIINGSYTDEEIYSDLIDEDIISYNNFNDIKITKGRLPINDYEIIVNDKLKYNMYINSKINYKVNNNKLKVVGYYESNSINNINLYLTNDNTIKYNLINNSKELVVYPKNDKFKEEFNNKNINVQNSYDLDKKEYINDSKDSIKSAVILSIVMISISLLEVFLMIRASFLSKVKEVGIYRAVGVKKSDIYKMFMGEIIAVTTIGSLSGILFMSYILYNINNISLLNGTFMINPFTITLSIILIYVFNLIVGLLPVFNVIRSTPSKILSRIDI